MPQPKLHPLGFSVTDILADFYKNGFLNDI